MSWWKPEPLVIDLSKYGGSPMLERRIEASGGSFDARYESGLMRIAERQGVPVMVLYRLVDFALKEEE